MAGVWQTVRMLQSLVAECSPEIQLCFTATEFGLRSIRFMREESDLPSLGHGEGSVAAEANRVLDDAVRQLRAYFAGALRQFTIPLDPQGTEFQKRVWRQLETIPFGEVRSYAQVAQSIGAPRAVRAVGAANGANPLPIVVPCHRVIGSGGKLVGYGGGLPLKKLLLDLEGCTMVLFRT
jgi:methylated-DNA-[protein]-cysteine S-methyltransferase